MDPVERLFVRTKGAIRPGLDRVRLAYDRINRPLDGVRVILVGGTNGKGTTAAFIATLLHQSGLSTALYSSPHLIDYTERLWIDGAHPDREVFCDALSQLEQSLDEASFNELSFFEVFSLVCFLIIGHRKPDVALIEVGMGGRWDATNITDPEISVITGVAIDHQEFLGSDLLGIAREKMGIARSGRPLFWGGGGLLPAEPGIEHQCLNELKERGVVVLRRGIEFGRQNDQAWTKAANQQSKSIEVRTQLNAKMPEFLLENLSLAFAVSQYFAPERTQQFISIAETLTNGGQKWPRGQRARFELVSVHWRGRPLRFLLDVCHNPDGAAALVRSIKSDSRWTNHGEIPAMVSILKDKDYIAILDSISTVSNTIVAFSCDSPRSWDQQCLRKWSADLKMHKDFPSALEQLLARPNGEIPLILVCGSVHAVGEVLSWMENLDQHESGGETR